MRGFRVCVGIEGLEGVWVERVERVCGSGG